MNATMRMTIRKRRSFKMVSYQMSVVPNFKTMFLLGGFLFSALALLYIQEVTRYLYSNYHALQKEAYNLKMENNLLLGEQSALNAQIKVQNGAAYKMKMKHPKASEIIVIKM